MQKNSLQEKILEYEKKIRNLKNKLEKTQNSYYRECLASEIFENELFLKAARAKLNNSVLTSLGL